MPLPLLSHAHLSSHRRAQTHLVLLETHVALFFVPRERLAAAPNILTWPHPLHKIGWEESNPVANLALEMRLAISTSALPLPLLLSLSVVPTQIQCQHPAEPGLCIHASRRVASELEGQGGQRDKAEAGRVK